MKKNNDPCSTAFSGLGIEHAPLIADKNACSLVLHEWGYLPACVGWNFESVFTPVWKLYYNTKAGHRMTVGEHTMELGPKRLILIPPHTIMHGEGRTPVPHLWAHFSFSKLLAGAKPHPVELVPQEAELALIRSLIKLHGQKKENTATQRDLLLATSLIYSVLSRDELVWKAPLPAPLQKLIDYIWRHFGSELKNSQLAKIAAMSESALNRLFQQFLGKSPARYILEIRIREAASLLQHSGDSIDLIAEKTGFSNRFYFSRMFKGATGQSPAEFRRNHIQEYVDGAQRASRS